MKTSFRKIFPLVTLAAFLPSPLFACAACYGRSDAPIAVGMNWGIFTLLGVVVPVLSCFLFFFVHLIRKSEALNAAAEKASQSAEATKP
ncbi:MAG TPA: hypothetical protein VIK53_05475 [Verrucomicrobiae bacterium]